MTNVLLYINLLTTELFVCVRTQIVAELLGTYVFVFVGCASALTYRDNPLTIVVTAIVWGLDFMVVKYTLAHISGAYINPAATIAFAIAQRFPWKHATSFSIFNCIASTYFLLPCWLFFAILALQGGHFDLLWVSK